MKFNVLFVDNPISGSSRTRRHSYGGFDLVVCHILLMSYAIKMCVMLFKPYYCNNYILCIIYIMISCLMCYILLLCVIIICRNSYWDFNIISSDFISEKSLNLLTNIAPEG